MYKYKLKDLQKRNKKLKVLKLCKVCHKVLSKRNKEGFCGQFCKSIYNGTRIIYKCEYCGEKHSDRISSYNKKKHHFCSVDCKNKWQSENIVGKNHPSYQRIMVKCEVCGKEIEINNYRINNQKHFYCSQECHNIGHSINYSGENHPMYGKHHNNESIEKISKSKKGKYIKENSPRWNPNLTDEDRKLGRDYFEYYDWRKQVYERDNYTCQCCRKKGGNINAHHLNGYDNFEDYRTDINNGITLCENCHKELHSIYGYGNNTIEQFREFLYNKYLQTKDIKYLVALEDTDVRKYAMTLKES